jgi:hypothetical protein
MSVTTEPPFLKSSPANAGTIANASGAECQKEGSSVAVSLSISLCEPVRRRLSVEDLIEYCAFEYTELRRRGRGEIGCCTPSAKVAARFSILCRSRGFISDVVLWASAGASAMMVASRAAPWLRGGGQLVGVWRRGRVLGWQQHQQLQEGRHTMTIESAEMHAEPGEATALVQPASQWLTRETECDCRHPRVRCALATCG